MVELALLDGEPAPEHMLEAGVLHGVTCFETVAIEGGQPALLDEHLERLAEGLSTLELAPDGGIEGVRQATLKAVGEAGVEQGIVRTSIHAAGSMHGLSVEGDSAHVLVVVTQGRYDELGAGVEAVTSTVRAPDPEAWPTGFKAPCLPRLLAHREARQRSAFEGLMLDARGRAVSGSRSNLFAVVHGTLATPAAPPALPGITRARVLDAAASLGLEVQQRPTHRDELGEAGELFLTLTGPGIVPVVQLDGAPIADGQPGEHTLALVKALARSSTGSR